MKRIAVLAVLALSIAPWAQGELAFTRVNATQSNQTITLNAPSVVIINDGASEVYIRVFWAGETAAAATTADAELKSSESLVLSKTMGVSAISVICQTSETATVRIFAW